LDNANKTLILSLGGSVIVPDSVDINFLKNFKSLILSYIGLGFHFVIVCGGGKVCRDYQAAACNISPLSKVDLDWLGIAATKLNAELVRSIFGELAYEKVVNNPKKKINTDKQIIIASGFIPGFSSDMDAVLFAKNLNSTTVINLFNQSYVYDKDPKTHPDAQPIKELSWKDYGKLIGRKWVPGMNVPFDPIASKKAQKLGLAVIIAKATDLENLKNIIEEKEFVGTMIK